MIPVSEAWFLIEASRVQDDERLTLGERPTLPGRRWRVSLYPLIAAVRGHSLIVGVVHASQRAAAARRVRRMRDTAAPRARSCAGTRTISTKHGGVAQARSLC